MEFIVMLFLAGAVEATNNGHERQPAPPAVQAAVAPTTFPFPVNWETAFPKELDTLFKPIKALCPEIDKATEFDHHKYFTLCVANETSKNLPQFFGYLIEFSSGSYTYAFPTPEGKSAPRKITDEFADPKQGYYRIVARPQELRATVKAAKAASQATGHPMALTSLERKLNEDALKRWEAISLKQKLIAVWAKYLKDNEKLGPTKTGWNRMTRAAILKAASMQYAKDIETLKKMLTAYNNLHAKCADLAKCQDLEKKAFLESFGTLTQGEVSPLSRLKASLPLTSNNRGHIKNVIAQLEGQANTLRSLK